MQSRLFVVMELESKVKLVDHNFFVKKLFQVWVTIFYPTGNIETKSLDTDVISRNVAIRNELDLFVNVIHCKSYSGVVGRQSNIDIVIVRQNTEGEYALLEHEVQTFQSVVYLVTTFI